MLRFGLTPEINAVGTAMVGLTVLLGVAGVWLQRSKTLSRSTN
jgi:ABC-type spermidine/putrescine transport system permease subunit II